MEDAAAQGGGRGGDIGERKGAAQEEGAVAQGKGTTAAQGKRAAAAAQGKRAAAAAQGKEARIGTKGRALGDLFFGR